MDQGGLLSSAVELALDLLEKNADFLPYCKAVDRTDNTFVYTPASHDAFSSEQAHASVRDRAKAEVEIRGLVGLAFCSHSRIRLSNAAEKVPAIEVEIHFHGISPTNWWFVYRLEGSKAEVLEYYNKALDCDSMV